MIQKNPHEAETPLRKVRKICKLLSILLLIGLIIVSLWWIVTSIFMALSLAGFDSFQIDEDASLSGLLSYLVHGVVVVTFLLIMFQIFTETTKGQSPFTIKQVKRLRIIAFLLLVYGVSDFIVSYNAEFLYFNGFTAANPSVKDAVLTLNITPFICSAAVYAFSFVFKYGVLLQEESDATM